LLNFPSQIILINSNIYEIIKIIVAKLVYQTSYTEEFVDGILTNTFDKATFPFVICLIYWIVKTLMAFRHLEILIK